MPIIDALFISYFSGCVMGKVFSLYLVLLLIQITFSLYGWLTGMNAKTVNVWKEFILFTIYLFFTAMLYYICNYGHYFANIVRYQNIIFEHIYIQGVSRL